MAKDNKNKSPGNEDEVLKKLLDEAEPVANEPDGADSDEDKAYDSELENDLFAQFDLFFNAIQQEIIRLRYNGDEDAFYSDFAEAVEQARIANPQNIGDIIERLEIPGLLEQNPINENEAEVVRKFLDLDGQERSNLNDFFKRFREQKNDVIKPEEKTFPKRQVTSIENFITQIERLFVKDKYAEEVANYTGALEDLCESKGINFRVLDNIIMWPDTNVFNEQHLRLLAEFWELDEKSSETFLALANEQRVLQGEQPLEIEVSLMRTPLEVIKITPDESLALTETNVVSEKISLIDEQAVQNSDESPALDYKPENNPEPEPVEPQTPPKKPVAVTKAKFDRKVLSKTDRTDIQREAIEAAGHELVLANPYDSAKAAKISLDLLIKIVANSEVGSGIDIKKGWQILEEIMPYKKYQKLGVMGPDEMLEYLAEDFTASKLVRRLVIDEAARDEAERLLLGIPAKCGLLEKAPEKLIEAFEEKRISFNDALRIKARMSGEKYDDILSVNGLSEAIINDSKTPSDDKKTFRFIKNLATALELGEEANLFALRKFIFGIPKTFNQDLLNELFEDEQTTKALTRGKVTADFIRTVQLSRGIRTLELFAAELSEHSPQIKEKRFLQQIGIFFSNTPDKLKFLDKDVATAIAKYTYSDEDKIKKATEFLFGTELREAIERERIAAEEQIRLEETQKRDDERVVRSERYSAQAQADIERHWAEQADDVLRKYLESERLSESARLAADRFRLNQEREEDRRNRRDDKRVRLSERLSAEAQRKVERLRDPKPEPEQKPKPKKAKVDSEPKPKVETLAPAPKVKTDEKVTVKFPEGKTNLELIAYATAQGWGISKLLEETHKLSGGSQNKFAAALGLDRAQYAKLVSGEAKKPPLEMMHKIAAVFGAIDSQAVEEKRFSNELSAWRKFILGISQDKGSNSLGKIITDGTIDTDIRGQGHTIALAQFFKAMQDAFGYTERSQLARAAVTFCGVDPNMARALQLAIDNMCGPIDNADKKISDIPLDQREMPDRRQKVMPRYIAEILADFAFLQNEVAKKNLLDFLTSEKYAAREDERADRISKSHIARAQDSKKPNDTNPLPE